MYQFKMSVNVTNLKSQPSVTKCVISQVEVKLLDHAIDCCHSENFFKRGEGGGGGVEEKNF